MAPAPREGPACLGSCCRQPSHSPASLGPDAQGVPAPSVPCGGRAAAPAPSWGLCHVRPLRPCSTPEAQCCGSVSPPRGRRSSTGILPDSPRLVPSCDRDTALHCAASGQLEEEPLPPCPRAAPVTQTPAPSLGRVPESLAAFIPTFPGRWGHARRVALAAAPAAATAPLFLPPHAPGLRDHRKATTGCATRVQPGPEVPLSPDWARPCPPGPQGPAWAAWQHSKRGAGWASPRHRRPASAPPGLPSPQPHVPSVPLPTGRRLARRMPPRASRAAICGVEPSPPGAGLAHPPLLTPWGVSLPIFECDFKVEK